MLTMRIAARRSIVTFTALALAPSARVTAQPLTRVAYDGKSARVEVFGLRRWSLRMLQDSIAKYAPGESLESGACAAILQLKLHFPAASVSRWIMQLAPDKPATTNLVIKVVEPSDRSRVRFTRIPTNGFESLRPIYAPLVLAVTDSDGAVWRGRITDLLQFAGDSTRRRYALADAHMHDDAARLYDFLDAHRAESDRRTAMTVLRTDGFPYNRMMAAAVLANFPQHDSTWYALVDAMRDPSEIVREAGGNVLSALPARRVNWRPAAPSLRALIAGTNLWSIDGVFETLDRTEVDPSLASALLRHDGEWLVQQLSAEYPNGKDKAHALLVRLAHGRDLGWSPTPWRAWIRTL